MSITHRFSVLVRIARPAPQEDALGSLQEAYAPPHLTLPARLVPRDGSVSPALPGWTVRRQLTLLLPPQADIFPGDGVWLPGDTAPYRCQCVQSYPLHTQAQLERTAP